MFLCKIRVVPIVLSGLVALIDTAVITYIIWALGITGGVLGIIFCGVFLVSFFVSILTFALASAAAFADDVSGTR